VEEPAISLVSMYKAFNGMHPSLTFSINGKVEEPAISLVSMYKAFNGMLLPLSG